MRKSSVEDFLTTNLSMFEMNLSLFQRFVNIFQLVVSTVLDLHSKGLVLNDIHPNNFIVNEEGAFFIDLEGSYMENETPILGIKSDIGVEDWNELDGFKADLHKLGNLALYLLGRMTVTNISQAALDRVADLLELYGLKTNFINYIRYLLSSEANDLEVRQWRDKICIELRKESDIIQDLNSSRIIDLAKVTEFCPRYWFYRNIIEKVEGKEKLKKIIFSHISLERNYGLSGVSGIILGLYHDGYADFALEGITFVNSKLVDTDKGKMLPVGHGNASPYINNGLAGFLQTLMYIDCEKYSEVVIDLRRGLYQSYAQYHGYFDGLLGIADTLILSATCGVDSKLINSINLIMRNLGIVYGFGGEDATVYMQVLNRFNKLKCLFSTKI